MARTRLLVDLEANSAKLVTEAEKSRKALDGIKKSSDSMKSSLSLIKVDALVNLGERAVRITKQVYDAAYSLASLGSEIKRMSETLGMSTTEYQQWLYVAKALDVEQEQLTLGIRVLIKNMGDLKSGTGEAKDALEEIGITAKDSNKNMGELLPIIIDRLSKIGDVARQNQLAMEIFGSRSGLAIANMVREGVNIEEIIKRFKELGGAISEISLDRLAQSEQAFKDMATAWHAFKGEVFSTPVSLISHMMERIIALRRAWDLGGIKGLYTEVINAQEKARIESLSWLDPLEKQMKGWKKIGGAGENEAGEEKYTKAVLETAKAYGITADELLRIRQGIQAGIKDNAHFIDSLKDVNNELETMNTLFQSMQDSLSTMKELGVETTAGIANEFKKLEEIWRKVLAGPFTEEEISKAFEEITKRAEELKGKYAGGGWKEVAGDVEGFTKWIYEEPSEKAAAASKLFDQFLTNVKTFRDEYEASMAQIQDRKIYLDDSEIIGATAKIQSLRDWLLDITTATWKVRIDITGTGSSEAPIMDKIQEIYGGFESMSGYISNLKFNFSLENLNTQIAMYQAQLTAIEQAHTPIGYYPGAYQRIQSAPIKAGLSQAMMERSMLLEAQEAYQMLGSVSGGGIGSAGISINIGTINIDSGDGTAAEQLDAELADLWEKNRSKLKQAVMS